MNNNTTKIIEEYFHDYIDALQFLAYKQYNDKHPDHKLVIVGGKAIEKMFNLDDPNIETSFDWDTHIIKLPSYTLNLKSIDIANELAEILNTLLMNIPSYIYFANHIIESLNNINGGFLILKFDINYMSLVNFKPFSGKKRNQTISVCLRLIINGNLEEIPVNDVVFDTSLPIGGQLSDISSLYKINNVMYAPFLNIILGLYDMGTRFQYNKANKCRLRLEKIKNLITNSSFNCDYLIYLNDHKNNNIHLINNFTNLLQNIDYNLSQHNIKNKQHMPQLPQNVYKAQHSGFYRSLNHENQLMIIINDIIRGYRNYILNASIIADCNKKIIISTEIKNNFFINPNLMTCSKNYLLNYDTNKLIYKYTKGSSGLNTPLIMYGLTSDMYFKNSYLNMKWHRSKDTINNTKKNMNEIITKFHINCENNKIKNNIIKLYKCSRYFNINSKQNKPNVNIGDYIYQSSFNSTSYKKYMSKWSTFITLGLPFYVYKIKINESDKNYIIIDDYATKQYNDEGELLLKTDIVFHVYNIKVKYIKFNDNNIFRYNQVYVLYVNVMEPNVNMNFINMGPNKKIIETHYNFNLLCYCPELVMMNNLLYNNLYNVNYAEQNARNKNAISYDPSRNNLNYTHSNQNNLRNNSNDIYNNENNLRNDLNDTHNNNKFNDINNNKNINNTHKNNKSNNINNDETIDDANDIIDNELKKINHNVTDKIKLDNITQKNSNDFDNLNMTHNNHNINNKFALKYFKYKQKYTKLKNMLT